MDQPVVFISHIQKEGALAQILKKHLNDCFQPKIKVFVSSDTENINAGENWLMGLDQALREADIQLILCSQASVSRPWVNFEAGAAWMKKISIIPVCHSGLHPAELSMPLAVLQAVEANQEAGLDRIFSRVASYLQAPKPRVALSKIAKKVRSFEESYAPTLKYFTRSNFRVEGFQADRILGSWKGTASDLEVAGYKLELPSSYQLLMNLRREGVRICGKLDVYVNERKISHQPHMELINIAGDQFTFSYQIPDRTSNHFGVMMFHLLPNGREMKGFFLTSKAFEPALAVGVIEFKLETS